MSYDPSRKRKKRKAAVPPQLRAWVYRRRSHDPKRGRGMATGYGTVGRKPYRRGARGGVAWSGGRTLRYDAPAKRGWHAKARGILGKVENNLQWIGVALGLLIPAEICRASHGANLYQYYVDATKTETLTLFGKDPRTPQMTPWQYLTQKFTNTSSVWCFAFWGSLVAQIATRFGALKPISPRANTAIRKLSLGTLIASIFGALFLGGGTPTANPGIASNPNSNLSHIAPSNPYTTVYTYGQ